MSNHRERLERTLSGEKPDRIPCALWQHFPVDDQSSAALARASIALQEQFDFDFVKISPESSFCLTGWGLVDEWQGNYEGTRTYLHYPVQSPDDWNKIKPLDPTKGSLGEQLECVAYLQKALPKNTPYIQTIFNPLTQAHNLLGQRHLSRYLRLYPDALKAGLDAILETTIQFIEELKKRGIAGIFLAIQHASYDILNEDEYREFGVPYDLAVLSAVEDCWFNVAHIHGDAIMYDLITDYPVQVLNWHDRETEPSLKAGLDKFSGCVCGGINRIESLYLGTPDVIRKEAKQAYEQTDGRRFILGTGCVLPVNTPYGNIRAFRDVVEELV